MISRVSRGFGTVSWLVAALVAVAVSAALAAPASAVVVHDHSGRRLGLALRRGITPRTVAGSLAAQQTLHADSGILTYHGGPVLHSSAPYLIFWDPGGEISEHSQTLMTGYFKAVSQDSGRSNDVYGVTRQYYDSVGYADYRQAFGPGQAILDTSAYPAPGCPAGGYQTCITDTQIQQELARLISVDGLPTDGSGSQLPQSAPVYFVVLPSTVNLCNPALGGATYCASNDFCSYHAFFSDGGNTVLYAAMPMLLARTEPKACQSDGTTDASGQPVVQEPNADVADVVINDLSHEDNEAITDPLLNGWYDPLSGDEEADGCSITGAFSPAQDTDPNAFLPILGGQASAGTLYDQSLAGNSYYTQSEWSNGDSNCMMQPSSGTIDPSFTAPSGPIATGASVTFDPTASAHSNPISSETWNFGDGTTAFQAGALAGVSHAYSAAGSYTISLTLVDNRGNVQTTTRSITVYTPPAASFTFSPTSPLEGNPAHFDATASSDPNPGGITGYAWDFGDGTTGSGATLDHTYPTPGTYTVRLTATDQLGLSSTTTHQITVADEAPSAAFTIGPGPYTAGQPVSLDGSGSSDPDGTISSWSWSFGDGQTAAGATPTHAFATPGTYTVTLTVTDSAGQTGQVAQQIIVTPASASLAAPPPAGDPSLAAAPPATTSLSFPAAPPPTAAFGVTSRHPAARLPVRFDGSASTSPGGTIIAYAWSFGDGWTGSGEAPAHVYRHAGRYLVKLTVLASSGLTAASAGYVTVLPGSRITRTSAFWRHGSRFVAITLSGPGTLRVGSRRLSITRARTVRVRLTLTRAQRRVLQRRGRLKFSVQISFAPRVGARSSTRVRLSFSR